jgi:citrate lyase synthetase
MSKKIEEEIIDVIRKHKICRISHIFAHYTKMSRATFYNNGFDKLDSIKEEMDNNRAKATNYLLNKWIQSDNPTLQIAAMRLVCEKEEHQLLNQQYIDHTSKGESIRNVEVTIKKDGND